MTPVGSGGATPEGLAQRCENILAGAGAAIEWVQDVRPKAPRLDRDADGLIEKLRRSRNLSRRLGAAAGRQLSIGVFGMSQAGKSYLISTLARGADGDLRTVLEGQHLDFIGHINPPGGGKEATGLVTRFTRQTMATPKGYPVALTLFTEADLVKILGNSFFHDFDRERVKFDTEPERIQQLLAGLEKARRPNPTGGIDADDMVDVFDYFDRRFQQSMEPLKADYWPTAIELAPYLQRPERARLLSVLWGGIGALTEAYVSLADGLARLDGARTVYAPLDALVVRKGDGFEWSENSIINVDVLNRLGKDAAQTIEVLPATAGGTGAAVAVPRSLLTALTAEMRFELAEPPVASLLEQVDLLDFPGYRGRLQVGDLDDVRRQVKRDDVDPVAQLLLRGKVAYLFERYTDDQEMNVLIMCTRCDSQIEITTLTPVLNAWVHSTQGETPQDRAERPCGLLWVLTQLDHRLKPKRGQTASQQQQEWNNMVHITLLERFSQSEWLQEWTPARPFQNVYLVRKPGFLDASIKTTADGEELELLPGEAERLAEQQALFLNSENVGRHIADGAAAWDAVLKLNDGGMERLGHALAGAARPETKLARIASQLDRLTEEIVGHRLGQYFFSEGADEVERKRKLADQVKAALEEVLDAFGELLFCLQPAAEPLRRLYLRADTAAAGIGAASEQQAGAPERPRRPTVVRLPTARAQPVIASRAAAFAKAVMSEWIRQLKGLPDSAELQRFLGLSAETLRAITDELVSASDRLRLEGELIEALRPLEEKRSTTRTGIVDQQVFLARGVVNEFVDTLGFAAVPMAERPLSQVDGRRIFEPPAPIPAGTLPQLPAEEILYTGTYAVDWMDAFRALAIGNAGHSAGREITPEQNMRLGEILKVFRDGPGAAAAS
ncbi:MAG TPA: putative virulence factor [Defluviicoccus sp.]|nr:putative virulence factor [Defluviicoccus sp.]